MSLSNKPTKRFTTYDQQLNILMNKYHFKVNNKHRAKKILSTLSYHDLINGFQECFFDPSFDPNHKTLEYLYSLYLFDRSIQNILFKYSTYVERIFKSKFSYLLAKNFGVHQDDYLDISKYNINIQKRQNKLNSTIQSIQYVYDKKNSVDQPTKHYLDTKENIPPWILFKNTSFSNVIDLYTFLKPNDKHELISEMLLFEIDESYKPEFLKNALSITRKFRNVIAHNLKFITYNTKKSKSASKQSYYYLILKHIKSFDGNLIKPCDYRSKRGQIDAYAMILSIVALIGDIHLITQFFREIELQIFIHTLDNEAIFKDYCRVTNLPLDIQQRFSDFIEEFRDSPKENDPIDS